MLRADQEELYTKDLYKVGREMYESVVTKFNQIFKVVSGVQGAGDKETQFLGAGPLIRHTTEGQDIDFKSPVQGWQFLVKYHTYSAGISLTKEAVEDTVKLGNLIRGLAATWGVQERVAKEEMGARVFNQGGALSGDWVFNGTHTGNTDASGDLMYDSKPLFNLTGNTRTTKGGGTYYNSVASLSLSSTANFETLYNLHTATNNRDERDNVVQNKPDTLLTKVGSDAFLAKRLLKSADMPMSQVNDINPYEDILQHMSWDYLDPDGTENAFFIGKRQHDDFQFHERQAPEKRFFRNESNGGYKVSNNIRIGVFLKNFRMWSRGGGTST